MTHRDDITRIKGYLNFRSFAGGSVGQFLQIAFEVLLRGLARVYGLFVAARNYLFRQGYLQVVELPCPVISIGNLTAGGTGKTPMVIHLSRWVSSLGRDAVILSRGYGRIGRNPFFLSLESGKPPDAALVAKTGDEPLLIALKCPDSLIGLGSSRVRTGRTALAARINPVILLDDGFQHRRLQRQIDILLIDSSRRFLDEQLLPAGLLREPVSESRRADIIVLTRTVGNRESAESVKDFIRHNWPDKPVFEANPFPGPLLEFPSWRELPRNELGDSRLLALSAIGNPESFTRSLSGSGLSVVDHIIFRDHRNFHLSDLEMIVARAKDHGTRKIVTTEKDGIRLLPFAPWLSSRLEVVMLSISMTIDDEARFFETIVDLAGPLWVNK